MVQFRFAILSILTALLFATPIQAQSRANDGDLAQMLRAGGYVIVFRHGATFPDQADTDPLNYDNVAQQRRLNPKGEEAAKALGQAFKTISVPIGKVVTSQYDRAYQTAKLAGFDNIEKSTDVTEGGLVVSPNENNRRAAAFRKLASAVPPAGSNILIITHKPNILDAFGKDWFDVKEGEATIFQPDGAAYKTIARVQMDAWLGLNADLALTAIQAASGTGRPCPDRETFQTGCRNKVSPLVLRTSQSNAGERGMRKLIAINQVSLDGIMQSPGGPQEDPRGDFELGGWVAPYWDEQLGKRLDQVVSSTFDLLLGRRTYEIFAAYWPYVGENPIADGFNRATKYVATRGKPELSWANSQALQGDVVEAVRQLKAQNGPEIQIYGSSSFLQTLIAADLIDEYLMWTFPLVLGRGKRLFEEGVPARALRLVETLQSATGVIASRYLPDGPVKPGLVDAMEPSKAELARRRRLAAEEA